MRHLFNYTRLDLRHEETFQSARSRQHRSRIVDKQIVFFLANRIDRAVVSSQIQPAGAPRSAQSSQIEPARTPRAARSSQSRPNWVSKGARCSQSEPIEARSSQQDAPGRWAHRPNPRESPKSPSLVQQFRYGCFDVDFVFTQKLFLLVLLLKFFFT